MRLLIAAQNQRLLRRVEIEADHLPEFGLKVLVPGLRRGRLSDSLKVRERCDLIAFAAHRRCTLACEIPTARAIVRQLHRASLAGGDTALSNTMRTAAGGNDGLRPRPGASSNPTRRWARKR